jgi:hypothetical protein
MDPSASGRAHELEPLALVDARCGLAERILIHLEHLVIRHEVRR